MSVKPAASKSSDSTIALICCLGQSGIAGDADVLAEFVARVLQSGYPKDDEFTRPQGERGAVEQLVDHPRPPGEDVGSVGEHSKHVELAPACGELADGFGLLVDVDQWYA